jgi:predicted RNA-binding protein with PIN domain
LPWLIDGSNVLGAMRVDRHGEETKRNLVRMLAAFARSKRTRVTCIFDGPLPPNFGTHLGSVTVAFSSPRSADDVIAERARNGRGWSVVTSDRALANRVRRREVAIVSPQTLIREIELAATETPDASADWEAYFSDPKNRTKF